MLAIETAALAVLIPLTIASITSSAVTIIAAFRNSDRTKDIQRQVTTINGRTLAQLGDATESRRIEALPHKDRTEADEEHLEVAPAPDE